MTKPKSLVYISGPFRGDTHWDVFRNVCVAEKIAYRAWQAGHAAICPHLNTQHFQGAIEDDDFLVGDLVMLSKCQEIWMVDGWQKSFGAKVELVYASTKNILCYEVLTDAKKRRLSNDLILQIQYTVPEVAEWLKERQYILP